MIEKDRPDSGAADGVRSLERGLLLLRAMNANPNLSVSQLGRQIGVPRSTVYRLLDTLRALGYVSRSDARSGVCLTDQVRRLSDGFVDAAWLEIAWPELLRLGRELFWPLSLFTFEESTMVVRRTTHEHSTMSIDYGMSGKRMPLTETAAGRAYLAFCPARERDWLLELPTICPPATTRVEREVILRQLDAARADGFGRRLGGLMPHTASLSVPVLTGDRVLCCVSIIWIVSAVTMEQAVATFARPLKLLAQRIADAAQQ